MALMNIFNPMDADEYPDGIPLGKPVANTWVYILDEKGNQVPIGVPGEICISSDFLSPGYYNQPDLSNVVFVDNPISDCDDNKRMYRTGDIGFYNCEGEVEIIGRSDDQLSVRGFRIESNEIAGIMKQFKEIDEVYLDVVQDNLIAYYAIGDDLNIDEVKNALSRELPYYMIPSIFIEVDEIPLNPNGKIDKFALRDIVRKDRNLDIEINDDVLAAV